MYNLAPIIVFVYNRPLHTRLTIEALKKNWLANKSELFIFCDAPRNENVAIDVKEVRKYIKSIEGFRKVTIIEQKNNLGLAKSIIDGVSRIVNMYGKVIVLEDDLVTSPNFLKFMNDSLDFYKDKKSVWHINGYVHPIKFENKNDVFFTRFSMSWGWATWNDRWVYFKREPEYLVKSFDNKMINEFNLDKASRSWNQVLKNYNGKMYTWAVFWYATIFMHNGLCLNPNKSLVKNIGHDGSGINCDSTNMYDYKLEEQQIVHFEKKIEVHNIAYKEIRKFYKKQRILKIISKLKSLFD